MEWLAINLYWVAPILIVLGIILLIAIFPPGFTGPRYKVPMPPRVRELSHSVEIPLKGKENFINVTHKDGKFFLVFYVKEIKVNYCLEKKEAESLACFINNKLNN